MRTADVVIVGGGPAGATVALSLLGGDNPQPPTNTQPTDTPCPDTPHLKNLQPANPPSVVILDKATFPRDKPCGDGISPAVVNLAHELDIADVFADCTMCDSYTFVGPNGTQASGQLPSTALQKSCGYVVPRHTFDYSLLEKARQRGAEIMEGHTFNSLSQDSSSVTISAWAPNKAEIKIKARAVVGADGASSRVRSAVGVPANPKNRTGIAMRAYARFDPDSKQEPGGLWVIFEENLLPGYAWLFPFQNGKESMANIGLGYVVADGDVSRRKFLEQLDLLVEHLGSYGIRFSSIDQQRTYLLPHGGKLPALSHGRVALIGDAGSMINPLSGEGIYYGMVAGHMLAQHMKQALGVGVIGSSVSRDGGGGSDNEGGGSDSEGDTAEGDTNNITVATSIKHWERQFKKRFARHLRHNYFAQRLMRHPRWANSFISAAAKDPQLSAKAASLMFGEGTISTGSFFRALRRLR